jgi:hypothetical protein
LKQKSVATAFEQMLNTAKWLAQGEVCLWFAAWSIRRKGEMDMRLDRAAHWLRWIVVVGGWLLASIPGGKYGAPRAVAGLVGLAFLCWPNIAQHTVGLTRRRRPN